jgi:hypothetical protein
MTSQGTAHGRFCRALERRNLRGVETAARELGRLSLGDALGLCVLYLQCAPARYERAALRWLERLIAEKRPSLEDIGLAVRALTELGSRNGNGPPRACSRSSGSCESGRVLRSQCSPAPTASRAATAATS